MGAPDEEAAAQLFGLLQGYLTVDDVIAWADEVILHAPTAPREIIEIATSAKDVGELQRRLHALIGSFEVKPNHQAVLKSNE